MTVPAQKHKPQSKRIYSLDLTRSFAVFLMVVGHCIQAYNDGQHMESVTLRLLQRAAPAVFIIIFGLFLELVYSKSMIKNGFVPTAKRLFSRAIQCYTLYVLSCIILALKEDYSLAYTVRMSVLLGATPYTDILKYYAFTLVLAPFLLVIKQRFGYAPLLTFCLITHIAHYMLYPEPYIGTFPGSVILSAMLYGASDIIAGPSLVHGITFVVTGMWLAEFMRKDLARPHLLDSRDPAVLYLFIVTAAWLGWIAYHYEGDLYHDLSSMQFRNTNSYIYYVFGIASSILIIDLFMRLTAYIGNARVKPFIFFGTTSLFIFCFGNCLLYITTQENLTQHQAITATILSIIASTAMSWGFDKFKNIEPKLDKTTPLMRLYQFSAKGYADRIAEKMAVLFEWKKPLI